MSQADFEQFKEIVWQDFSLHKELWEISERRELFDRVVEIGEKYGLRITNEDLEEIWQENGRRWIER